MARRQSGLRLRRIDAEAFRYEFSWGANKSIVKGRIIGEIDDERDSGLRRNGDFLAPSNQAHDVTPLWGDGRDWNRHGEPFDRRKREVELFRLQAKWRSVVLRLLERAYFNALLCDQSNDEVQGRGMAKSRQTYLDTRERRHLDSRTERRFEFIAWGLGHSPQMKPLKPDRI